MSGFQAHVKLLLPIALLSSGFSACAQTDSNDLVTTDQQISPVVESIREFSRYATEPDRFCHLGSETYFRVGRRVVLVGAKNFYRKT